MIENSKLDIAQEYFKKAYKLHLEGKIEEAVDYYRMSIDIYPTAEAHTFLGWAYSLQGKFEDAIDECHTAIELDDSYGNPYNDIGAYLIDLGRYDDSVEWFERAIMLQDMFFAIFHITILVEFMRRKGIGLAP
jgi:tetratricopeptide (TPR) repeat protein